MKIGDIFRSNMVSGSMGSSGKQSNRAETKTTSLLSGDTLELSEGAQKYAQFSKEVRASLGSAESKEAGQVEALSKEISEGTYQPDLDDVIERMMTVMA